MEGCKGKERDLAFGVRRRWQVAGSTVGEASHHHELLHRFSFSAMLAFTDSHFICYCDVHTVLCQAQVKEKWSIK